MNVHKFQEENMTILMDDGNHMAPTRQNILDAYKTIVSESQPGDVVFCHYSGHGGKVRDENGDEDDGYDETLIPLDYARTGQIVDDDLVRPSKTTYFCGIRERIQISFNFDSFVGSFLFLCSTRFLLNP